MADPFAGLQGDFSFRLQQMINASGGRAWITSGYRSPEHQADLFQAAVRKYGSEEAARHWVAPPGKSHHNMGIAADLGFANASARQWFHDHASDFGLHFPMGWEPWHIEPTGSVMRGDRNAYTTPPGGFVNPHDAQMAGLDANMNVEDPFDPGVQMRRLFQIMEAGPEAAQDLMSSPQLEVGADSMTEALGGQSPDQQAGGEPAGEQGPEPEAQAAAIAEALQQGGL